MKYQKFNVAAETRKLANGKPTKAPAWMIAGSAVPPVEAGLENREVTELERLFKLSDDREDASC